MSHSCIAQKQKPRGNILSQSRQTALPAKSHFYLLSFFYSNQLYLFGRSAWSKSSLSRFTTSKPICPSLSISPPTQTSSFCFVYFRCIFSNSLTCFHYELINFIFLLVCFLIPGFLSIYLLFPLHNRKNIPEISQKDAFLENRCFHREYQL